MTQTVTVVSRVPGACFDWVGTPWEFDVQIGRYMPGEYSLVHVFESIAGPRDPVTTGFVVEAQVVPASGTASRLLGVLVVLVLGLGMLWRHRVGEAPPG